MEHAVSVRSTSDGHWCWVDRRVLRHLLRNNRHDLLVYLAICMVADGKTQTASVSIRGITVLTGVSPTSVRRALLRLAQRKLLSLEIGDGRLRVTLLKTPEDLACLPVRPLTPCLIGPPGNNEGNTPQQSGTRNGTPSVKSETCIPNKSGTKNRTGVPHQLPNRQFEEHNPVAECDLQKRHTCAAPYNGRSHPVLERVAAHLQESSQESIRERNSLKREGSTRNFLRERTSQEGPSGFKAEGEGRERDIFAVEEAWLRGEVSVFIDPEEWLREDAAFVRMREWVRERVRGLDVAGRMEAFKWLGRYKAGAVDEAELRRVVESIVGSGGVR